MNPLSESTYLVLLALYQQPLHGYGIIKEIEQVSEGAIILAPGTLYGVLKNLQKQGLIETIAIEKEQRKKKTYAITEQGKEALHIEYVRYIRMTKLSEKVIPGGLENERE
ncbi:PadR family transcriptional regulator [Gracilibacillus sp. S3-1-1]|uniref:PadR family transcriptional regulator n=1 Tax=Gracilibacillus pellucidus TaxID=3095368 RepID=A0ACC6M330_9BACI|nr:PadR family transcriptional regulator [Gracilibacillus sp. S3-1-1]MDX8045303.1 PadR family transcriptional regulator [Gracilibacillus sp. S3-1-1]